MKYLQSFVKRFCSKAALSAAPDDAAAAAAAAASAGEIWGGGASPGGGRGGGQAWGEAPTSAKDPAGCCAARRAAASASGSETERANPKAVAASRGARNSSFEWANWHVFVAAYGQWPAMKYLQSRVLKRLADRRRSGDAAARFGGPCRNSSNE